MAKRHPGVLLRFGGHAMAAGCTIAGEHFEAFEQGLTQVAQEWLDAATLTRRIDTDGPLAPEYRRVDLVDTLHHEVWGQGFAPPTFSEEVEVVSQRLVGEKHLALKLKHQGQPVDAIWFGHTDPLPPRVTLAFRLDADEWNGVRRVAFPGGRRCRLRRPGSEAFPVAFGLVVDCPGNGGLTRGGGSWCGSGR